MLSLVVITLVVLISIVNAIDTTTISTVNINSIFNDINVCNDLMHIKREYSRFHRIGSIEEDGRSLSNSGMKHTVVFAVKQNFKALEEKLYDVSTPKSSNYRNHLSRDEVSKIGSNPTDANAVLRILSSIEGLEILSSTIGNEYITCRGDVQLFETLFKSKFSKFTYKDESAIRMKDYSLPKCLSDLVGGVLNVVDLPFDFEKSSRAKAMTPTADDSNHRNLAAASNQTTSPTTSPTYSPGAPTPVPTFSPTSFPSFNGIPVPPDCVTGLYGSTYCNNFTTIASPQFISFLYNISSNDGSTSVSQGVYEDSQLISIADLQEFEVTFGLPQENITSINGGTEPGPCTAGFSECGEANLDVQYLTALAQNTPTETWWYDNTITTLFNSFIIQMANSTDPPLVMSMSYAWYEAVYTSEQLTLWNTEACKLGIQGVTILAAAGDAGVAGPLGGFEGPSFCG